MNLFQSKWVSHNLVINLSKISLSRGSKATFQCFLNSNRWYSSSFYNNSKVQNCNRNFYLDFKNRWTKTKTIPTYILVKTMSLNKSRLLIKPGLIMRTNYLLKVWNCLGRISKKLQTISIPNLNKKWSQNLKKLRD